MSGRASHPILAITGLGVGGEGGEGVAGKKKTAGKSVAMQILVG